MKAIVGAVDESATAADQDELYLVVLERVDKELSSELLIACIEVLERHNIAGSVHRTESGGVLLSGHKEST